MWCNAIFGALFPFYGRGQLRVVGACIWWVIIYPVICVSGLLWHPKWLVTTIGPNKAPNGHQNEALIGAPKFGGNAPKFGIIVGVCEHSQGAKQLQQFVPASNNINKSVWRMRQVGSKIASLHNVQIINGSVQVCAGLYQKNFASNARRLVFCDFVPRTSVLGY